MTSPQIDDDDIDVFVAKYLKNQNLVDLADRNADRLEGIIIGILRLNEPDKSAAWIKEFARRARARALWLKV
jgi:hypothetical protein